MSLKGATVVLLVASLAGSTAAQVELETGYDAGYQLFDEPVDAHTVGMGGAGTASDGHGFFHYNPAKPGLDRARYLSLEYGTQTGDLRRAMLEAAWFIKDWFVAAGVPTSTIADIQAADERGTLPLFFNAQSTMIALSVGYTWRDLTVALGLHGAQERIDIHSAYALSLSLGATYWVIPGRLSVGAAGFYPRFLTARRSMLTEEWGEGAYLNRTARAGVAWRDSVRAVGYTASMDVVYNDALENVTVPIGLEIRPLRFIALRMGKRINHDTDRFNMGIGFRLAPVTVDASFVITKWVDDAGLKWLVGVGYSLGGKTNE